VWERGLITSGSANIQRGRRPPNAEPKIAQEPSK
jgi:hypothetical protein